MGVSVDDGYRVSFRLTPKNKSVLIGEHLRFKGGEGFNLGLNSGPAHQIWLVGTKNPYKSIFAGAFLCILIIFSSPLFC